MWSDWTIKPKGLFVQRKDAQSLNGMGFNNGKKREKVSH
jgi:hypothetical protein